MSEVFICKTARTTGSGAITTHKDNLIKRPLDYYGWWACGFTTTDYEKALDHVEETDHWVESHRNGAEGNPVMREVHGSDVGGVYVQDYRARRWNRGERRRIFYFWRWLQRLRCHFNLMPCQHTDDPNDNHR
jgi:hypothetical protein